MSRQLIELPDQLWSIVIEPEYPPVMGTGGLERQAIVAFHAYLQFCDADVYSVRYSMQHDSDTFERAVRAIEGADYDRGIEIIGDAFKRACADRLRMLMLGAFDFASRSVLAGRRA